MGRKKNLMCFEYYMRGMRRYGGGVGDWRVEGEGLRARGAREEDRGGRKGGSEAAGLTEFAETKLFLKIRRLH